MFLIKEPMFMASMKGRDASTVEPRLSDSRLSVPSIIWNDVQTSNAKMLDT